jgi:D-arginine dehydrogenase
MIASDCLVIGAGIAGASAAFELAAHGSVRVLEREPQPGYHATGRSAALFTESYGNAAIRALTRGSRRFFLDPPAGFVDAPLVRDRGVLYIASADQGDAFAELRAAPDIAKSTVLLGTQEALARVPILRPESVHHAAYEAEGRDVDVNGLHQGFLRGLRKRGGSLIFNCVIDSIAHDAGRWIVTTAGESYAAPVLVNAAGAWADEIARLAGVDPLGIEPRRRTAVIIDPPAGVSVNDWPMVLAADESFYFKPDAGKLLVSPADETPSAPCDAQPEDLDVAIAVDRLEAATTLTVSRVSHRWAGLRTFVRDRSPVVGFDANAPGFCWLAAQGGYGIQTAPALSKLTAALVRGLAVPDELVACGVDSAALAPARLRSRS